MTLNPVRKGLVELHTVQLLHFIIQRKKNYSTCNESHAGVGPEITRWASPFDGDEQFTTGGRCGTQV